MKTAAIAIAIGSLLAGSYASWLFFRGTLPEGDFRMVMTIVTLAWFVCATYWAYHKKS